MSLSSYYRDNNVLFKKRYSTIKIVDEARTKEDKSDEQNPDRENRIIYNKVFLTYSGMIVNPLKDVRLFPLPNNNTRKPLSKVNAFIEVPGGTNIIYEPQTDKNNEFNYCAPYENGSSVLQETIGLVKLADYASYGFLPQTLSSATYDYRAFFPNQNNNTTIYGDGEALDVLLFGQSSGNKAREIAEVVEVKILSCVIGKETKVINGDDPPPPIFEAVCIAITNDDPRFSNINSMQQWKAAADSNPNSILSYSYAYCVGSIRQLLGIFPPTAVKFEDFSTTQRVVSLQLAQFNRANG